MALTTTFKKSVPYNTIRLSKDVAQWAQTEQTYANNTSLPPVPNVQNTSMSTLQTAAGSNIDPGDGTMDSGSLGNMRYGVSVLADISTGDGVYASQVNGTTSDFVGTRNYNLSSNPANIRLSRLAQWDYTANLEVPDMDIFELATSSTADWRCTSHGAELFKDMPMWGWGARDSANTSSRKVYLIRSNPNGGRFSSYAVTNRLIVSHVADMNDISALVPVRSEFGSTFDTQIRSYITFGRRTASTGNIKAALYNILIDPPTNTWTSTNSSTANLTTQHGSNAVAQPGCYLRDDLVAIIATKGGSGKDLLRVSTTGGTISSTRISLTGVAAYSVGSEVISIKDEEGSSPLAFPIWTENRSTYNRYVKMAAYNLNSGITSVATAINVFDLSNTIKSAGGALLNAGTNLVTNPHVFLVWCSDTSGNIRLQIVKMAQNTLSIGGGTYASTTISYGDTDLNNMVVISPLSAVEKTEITTSGEAFVPGGSNDFNQRRYFSISASTNQSQDTNRIYYGYYDITDDVLVVWDGGSFTGRETRLARSDYDTDGRQYARDLYLRGEAGAVWMPFLGGRYVSSTDRRLEMRMASLDYKPNWSGLNAADPGGTFYDQANLVGTGAYFDDPNESEPEWDVEGRWYVLGPHPLYPGNTTNLCAFRSSYASNVTFSDGVGSGLDYFWCYDRDIDNFAWNDFIKTSVAPYNTSSSVYIRIKTGTLSATYVLPAGNKQVMVDDAATNPYFLINFLTSNSHSNNQWGFLWNTSTGETKNAVAITFSQSPF